MSASESSKFSGQRMCSSSRPRARGACPRATLYSRHYGLCLNGAALYSHHHALCLDGAYRPAVGSSLQTRPACVVLPYSA
eukprot:1137034-Pelagomonas_calceolata.AAC.5